MYSVLFAKFEKKRISRRKKFKDQIAVIFRVSKLEFERIRGKKIRFSPSLSVDRISSPPPRNGGASSPCFVHDTYRILEGEGKGWIAVPFEKFSLKITIRYNCK